VLTKDRARDTCARGALIVIGLNARFSSAEVRGLQLNGQSIQCVERYIRNQSQAHTKAHARKLFHRFVQPKQSR
jgi:hypothetical protein